MEGRKKVSLKESQIELQICFYLRAKGYFFWKQPMAGFFDERKCAFRKHANPFVRNGVPDVIIVRDGKFIGLEIKKRTGRQTDAQKAFQKDLEKAGGKYFIIRSLDDLKIAEQHCFT